MRPIFDGLGLEASGLGLGLEGSGLGLDFSGLGLKGIVSLVAGNASIF